jgi:hypothetical protein
MKSGSILFYFPALGEQHQKLTAMKTLKIFLVLSVAALSFGFKSQDERQVWELTDDAGQTVRVAIYPFTYSGTFNETSDSPGWYISCEDGGSVRIPVSGTIAHNGDTDSWTFTFSLGSCGCTVQGQGEGTSLVNASGVSVVGGTYTMTSSGCDVSNADHNWDGVRMQ